MIIETDNDMKNFVFKKTAWRFISDLIKRKRFSNLTQSALPIFVKGDDNLAGTMAVGYHEDYLVQFFKSNAAGGLNDFFIDIGANIGLISCQVGTQFKEVHMYEPNPLLVKILDVNTQIMLDDNANLYPFGLGSNEGTFELTIPKNNWGGAFINDIDNQYSQDSLVQKDGYLTYDSKNYLLMDIKVNNIVKEMNSLFCNLKARGLSRGCIKIDVEGYEEVIVAGLTKTIPDDFEVVLVCESWGSKKFSCLQEQPTAARISCGRLAPRKEWLADSGWIKALQLILRGYYQYSYVNEAYGSEDGDIVVHINPVS